MHFQHADAGRRGSDPLATAAQATQDQLLHNRIDNDDSDPRL